MPVYHLQSEGLTPVRETPFRLEREIQNLVEANLMTLLGLELLSDLAQIRGRRQTLMAAFCIYFCRTGNRQRHSHRGALVCRIRQRQRVVSWEMVNRPDAG